MITKDSNIFYGLCYEDHFNIHIIISFRPFNGNGGEQRKQDIL